MTDGSLIVEAQWALQGKTLGRGGYRVLACSTGGLTMENFTDVIGRFSMGTPEKQPNALPQVTISYLRQGQVDHLALAIHRLASDVYPDGQLTATDDHGRPVVATSYYCVPYTPVAQRSISYRDMYRAFAAVPLRPENGPVLAVEMPAAPATPDPDVISPLAIKAAALLLTGRPVCVLGAAPQTSMTDRLGFIDAVMTLLPYGFRARMTAATWTRATYHNHRFRLFFSGARRDVEDPDHGVVWGDPEQTALDRSDSYAYDYYNWLSTGPAAEKMSVLAGLRQPRSLATPPEVIGAFGAIDKAAPRSVPPLRRRSLFRPLAETAPDRPENDPGPARDTTVPARSVIELLLECAQCMEEADSRRLGGAIGQLKREARSGVAAGERDRCRELIREHRLFRHDAVPAKHEEALRAVLLDIAFLPPLSYEAYCLIEDALGEGDGPDPSLLHLIDRHGADDRVKAITYRQLPDGDAGKKLTRWYASRELTADGLLNLLALDVKRPLHMWLLCEVATDYLKKKSTSYDPVTIDRVLREHSYLAGKLQRSRIGTNQYQLDTLGTFLQAAYPNGLTREDLYHVMTGLNDPVTLPFLGAVILSLANPDDAHLACDLFGYYSLALMDFDGPTKRALTPLIVIPGRPSAILRPAASPRTETAFFERRRREPLLPRTELREGPTRAVPADGQVAPPDGQPDEADLSPPEDSRQSRPGISRLGRWPRQT